MLKRKLINSMALGTAALVFGGSAIAADYDTLNLVSANQLLGHDILAMDGEEAGEIEYLLVDASSARVRYAIVGEGGELELEDAEFVAVPFSDLTISESDDDEYTVRASLSQLQGARRFSEDSLDQLTDAVAITELYEYYGTSQQDRIRSGSDHAQGWNQQNLGQNQPQNQNLNLDRSRTQTQPGDDVAQSQDQLQQDNEEVLFSPDGNGDDRLASSAPHVLVAREYVSTIIPGMRDAEEIVGRKVITESDDDFGNIEKLMLDTDGGRIAFAVVEAGGVLGIGADHYPIPLQRMTWMPEEEAYMVNYVDVADIDDLTGLTESDEPAAVSRAQLDRFYQAFGLNAYGSDAIGNESH